MYSSKFKVKWRDQYLEFVVALDPILTFHYFIIPKMDISGSFNNDVKSFKSLKSQVWRKVEMKDMSGL